MPIRYDDGTRHATSDAVTLTPSPSEWKKWKKKRDGKVKAHTHRRKSRANQITLHRAEIAIRLSSSRVAAITNKQRQRDQREGEKEGKKPTNVFPFFLSSNNIFFSLFLFEKREKRLDPIVASFDRCVALPMETAVSFTKRVWSHNNTLLLLL